MIPIFEKLSYLTLFYIFSCMTVLIVINFLNKSILDNNYYRVGPHDSLYVFGIHIHNFKMYTGLICFSLINILFREVNQDLINPWLINHVQNISVPKPTSEIKKAMWINSIYTLYTWFDWFISINMITTQIDLLMIESIFHILISNISTFIYYKKSLEWTSSGEDAG